jgi:hypothetical protein
MKKIILIAGVLALCATSFAVGHFVSLEQFFPVRHATAATGSVTKKAVDDDGTHLVPVGEQDIERLEVVRGAFKEAYEVNVRVRAYSWGFGGDRMVFLVEKQGHFDVVVLRIGGNLYRFLRTYHLTGDKPPEPGDDHSIKPDRCAVSIPTAVGLKIVKVWHDTLLGTRYYARPFTGSADGGAIYSMEQEIGGRIVALQGQMDRGPSGPLNAFDTLVWEMQLLCKVDKAPPGAIEYSITPDEFTRDVNRYPNISID